VTLGSAGGIGAHAIVELFSEKRLEMVAPVFVGLSVQVQADDRKRPGLEPGETVELRG
jgi:hypothetical protein